MTLRRVDDLRRFGPKAANHPSVGRACPACHEPFCVGDYTTLVPLGPGDDSEQQARARDNQAHAVVAVEVHWACATGFQA